MTEKTQPTDAELDMIIDDVAGLDSSNEAFRKFARAVLSKWGTPQQEARARSVAPDPRPVVEMCAKALAEELAAWDIDPPLHHVKEAHDACESWLAAAPQPVACEPLTDSQAQAGAAPRPVTAAEHEVLMAAARDNMTFVAKGRLVESPEEQAADSGLEDAARLDFLIKQRAYVVSDPDSCPGYWLHFVHKETGKCWVQGDEHPTPRAAIDAAMKEGGA